ncbi:MAG TPA: ester cyclase [Chthoniobacteraceae bacterium]|nr:ester cyclase [Chthoniobacteraceae bacterium]
MGSAFKEQPIRNTKPGGEDARSGLSPSRMCDLVRRWFEDVLSGTVADPSHAKPGIWDAADVELGQLFTRDFVNHIVPCPPGGWKRGVAGAVQIIQSYRVSCPDLTIEIEEQMVSGDKVITRYMAEGTHTAGKFLHMPANSHHYKVSGIAIDRIENGKIAESWGQWDTCSLLIQMGVLPADLQALD